MIRPRQRDLIPNYALCVRPGIPPQRLQPSSGGTRISIYPRGARIFVQGFLGFESQATYIGADTPASSITFVYRGSSLRLPRNGVYSHSVE